MLLSRVADSLYWISRYLERAEHTARLVAVRLDLGLDRRKKADGWDFSRLYASLRVVGPKGPAGQEEGGEAEASGSPAGQDGSPAWLIDHIILDPTNPESVASCVRAARENARQVREEISSEMWEQINGLFLRLNEARLEGTWSDRPHYLAKMVTEGTILFAGVTDATMGHGEGWQYLRVGRFLERAEATAALLDLHFRQAGAGTGPSSQGEWVGLLKSCAALEAYCRHYTADLSGERIVEFLLLSAECPRSVRFSAARVESALRAIAGHAHRRDGGRAERLAGRLHASLDYAQFDEILGADPHAYLGDIERYCGQIHAAVHQHYTGYAIETALPA